MDNTTFLSRFTPSTMSSEALEAIFVKRGPLAKRITDLVRDSVLTGSKHHTLLIGPRGVGKTHFVSLVYYRLRDMGDLSEGLLIAWLREDEWGIASFLDLLLALLHALCAERPSDAPAKEIEAIYRLAPREAERKAAALLKTIVGTRTILMIAENLNDIFMGLGEEGQQKWRSFLQENPFSTILATSQSLFDEISLQTSPFYGFFRVEHLQPFTLDEAIELLGNIARFRGDTSLAALLRTPIGRARVQAVEHLAGSNPRVYVIFSQFINFLSLDELVEPVLRTLDDLTPFYQSRMSQFSPQQRKIVDLLCECRHPVQVAEIAQRCFITSQTASGQLAKLRDLGYVHTLTLGRESFYEIHEPLMRLCAEVKKQRGESIRLFVEFLRLWYSQTELEHRFRTLGPDAPIEREYLTRALRPVDEENGRLQPNNFRTDREQSRSESTSGGDMRISLVGAVDRELTETRTRRDRDVTTDSQVHFEEALATDKHASEIVPDNAANWRSKGIDLGNLGRYEEALVADERAIELAPDEAINWANKGMALSNLGRFEEALAANERAIELAPDEVIYWRIKGFNLDSLERHEQALAAFERAIELAPDEAVYWQRKGITLERLNRYVEALAAYEQAIALAPDDAANWQSKGVALSNLGRYEEALVADEQAIALAPDEVANWHNKGIDLSTLGRYVDALAAHEQAIALAPDNAANWQSKGIALGNLERYEEALLAIDKSIEVGPRLPDADSLRARLLLACDQWTEAVKALDDSLQFSSVSARTTSDPPAFLQYLLERVGSSADWPARIASLLETHQKHGTLAQLGQELVRTIVELRALEMKQDKRKEWLRVWRRLAGSMAEMQLPLRLLGAAVGFLETSDRRQLLKLSSEERAIVQPLLGLEELPTKQ